MTAAVVWAVLILAGSILSVLSYEQGKRAERRLGRQRIGRRNSEDAFEAVTLAGVNDADLADNDRWSRKVRHLEVAR